MGDGGRPVRFGDALPFQQPAVADLLDPIALEQRLKEARARRAAALAGRKLESPPPRPEFAEAASAFLRPDGTVPPPARAPATAETFDLPAPPPATDEPTRRVPAPPPSGGSTAGTGPETTLPLPPGNAVVVVPANAPDDAAAGEGRDRPFERLVRVPVWAIFATGIALGAAVVALIGLAPAARPPGQPAPFAAADVPAADTSVSEARLAAVSEADTSVGEPAIPPSGRSANLAAPAVSPTGASAVAPAVAAVPEEAPPPVPAAAAPILPDSDTDAAATVAAVATPADLPPPAAEPARVPADALETVRLAPAVPAAPAAETPPGAEGTGEAGAVTPAAPRELAPRPRAQRPQPATPPSATVASAAMPARVAVHYPASAAASAEDARSALAAAGIANVALVPVRFDISRSNVRFYHAADEAAATTVAGLVAAGGEPPLTRDFTDYQSPAAGGTVELWLAGASPARARAPASSPEAEAEPETATTLGPAPTTLPPGALVIPDQPSALPAPLPGAAPPKDQAEAVARIIVERAYERLMRAMPGN